jgi:hypothetical protein
MAGANVRIDLRDEYGDETVVSVHRRVSGSVCEVAILANGW